MPWSLHDRTVVSVAFCCLHNGLKVGDANSGVRAFKLNFGEGETTEIQTTNFTNYTNKAGAWFTIDGRKLSGEPTTKGIYIFNGKKVKK